MFILSKEDSLMGIYDFSQGLSMFDATPSPWNPGLNFHISLT